MILVIFGAVPLLGRTVRVSMSRKTIVRQRSFGQFLLISLLVGSVFFSGIAYAADSGTTPSKKASSATSEKQKIRQEMAPVNPTPLGLEPRGGRTGEVSDKFPATVRRNNGPGSAPSTGWARSSRCLYPTTFTGHDNRRRRSRGKLARELVDRRPRRRI